MSSSSPCLDIHHTTDAVIQWESDGKTRSLSKGDPKATPVTLTTRFDKTCAFFELSVPLKLKAIDHTTITLRACASSIVSLDLVKNPTVPDALQQELDSIGLCLSFTLNRHLDVFLPTAALEPVSPARAPSGLVLDAVRDLCQATAFSIFIEARENPGFQAISDAASQGLLKSFRSSRFQLASMYGGQGAKLVVLAGDALLPPPSYNEVEPPPPPPPIDLKNDRKRPRQDSQNEHNNNIALIWKELQDMRDIMSRDEKRIEALETENKKLRQDNKDLSQGMETSQQDLKHSLEVLDTDSERFMKMATEELLDTYDNDLVELREDMRAMEQAVKYIEEGHVSDESVKRIKDAVVQDITTRLSAD
ncbi:uncharacterized protein QYS62_001667 [Fusarium acuminatum]|uniref:Uncharacterized protein n=1 Tax=Fusarium acuminatum TaxID=5515 RepID=A0ABZ2WJ68_9HYPO